MKTLIRKTNGGNIRHVNEQAELAKKAMESDLAQSGINEAQAAAIATAIAGSEVRTREHFDDRFDALVAQVASLSAEVKSLAAKVNENEKTNAARILTLALWTGGLIVASTSAVIAAVAFFVS